MQPCFDFRNGFSCDICVDFQPIPRPQEKRSFSGQFKYKVQSFGSCILLIYFQKRPIMPPDSDPPPAGRKDSWRGAAAGPARRTNHPNPFYADHPWLPFHRCPMRRSFYNQKGVKFRRNFPS